MFKLIFFSLIFTPCCKYAYSKNNVKFLKSTSSEISLKAKFTFEVKQDCCCFNLLVYSTTISDNFSCKFFV